MFVCLVFYEVVRGAVFGTCRPVALQAFGVPCRGICGNFRFSVSLISNNVEIVV